MQSGEALPPLSWPQEHTVRQAFLASLAVCSVTDVGRRELGYIAAQRSPSHKRQASILNDGRGEPMAARCIIIAPPPPPPPPPPRLHSPTSNLTTRPWQKMLALYCLSSPEHYGKTLNWLITGSKDIQLHSKRRSNRFWVNLAGLVFISIGPV